MEKRSVIYLAGGCFWGTEHFMKQVRGVEKTRVGYANSALSDPSIVTCMDYGNAKSIYTY